MTLGPLASGRSTLSSRHTIGASSMQSLRALFDDSSEAVLGIDGNGCRVYANRALSVMLDTDARHPIGTAAPPPYVPVDQHREYWRVLGETMHAMSDREPFVTQLEFVSRLHRRWRVRVSVTPFPGTDVTALAVWVIRPIEDPNTAMAAVRPLPRVSEFARLTPREREVLDLLLEGRRVVSIARALCVSEHTVRNHLKSIFRKLDAHSQGELIDHFRSDSDRA
jgi:DNA-binding CsgD family transcriptional regulator